MIGFLDESSPQTATGTPRLWSFVRKPKIFKNTQSVKANANTFYAPNGNNVIVVLEDSRINTSCKYIS